jgi:hypothetical protein
MDYHHEFDVQMLHEISLSKQLNIYIYNYILYYNACTYYRITVSCGVVQKLRMHHKGSLHGKDYDSLWAQLSHFQTNPFPSDLSPLYHSQTFQVRLR